MNENNQPITNSDPRLDQFALSEVLGGDYITSSRAMKVLRQLRKKGAITEGKLASSVNEKVFLHEWSLLITKLLELNYVKSDMTGRGLTKLISLTENGELFLEDRFGPKEPKAQPEL